MSRVGKHPVEVPSGVEVAVNGQLVSAKGKLGSLEFLATEDVTVALEDGKVTVQPVNDGQRARAMWGTVRSRVQSLVTGVSEGFTKLLEINGVGYKAEAKGKEVHFALGYSHPVIYQVPEGVNVEVDKSNRITVTGADRQKVGQVAAEIRSLRKPEPYKGKGIKYVDEVIRRKVGKAGAAALSKKPYFAYWIAGDDYEYGHAIAMPLGEIWRS